MSELIPFKVGDLAGLSEPVTKLIECISNAIGSIYEPRKIIETAKAEAEAKIENAKADAAIELIKWQTQKRLEVLEERRQSNINKIVVLAIQHLPEQVEQTRPDEDWIAQYFNYSQDFSNEEMQLIWAQILAGEVAKPGTYSQITLNTVRLMNQADALMFKLLSNYLWNKSFVFSLPELTEYFINKGLSWPNLMNLETLKIITILSTLDIKPNDSKILSYGKTDYIFKNNKNERTTLFGYTLTKIGSELLNLCNPEQDNEYLQKVIQLLSSDKYSPLEITPQIVP